MLPTYTPGAIVKYADPVDADEAAERFTVLEDRDTRVLLRPHETADWPLPPTCVRAKADLTEVL